jgi:hypothetical protein
MNKKAKPFPAQKPIPEPVAERTLWQSYQGATIFSNNASRSSLSQPFPPTRASNFQLAWLYSPPPESPSPIIWRRRSLSRNHLLKINEVVQTWGIHAREYDTCGLDNRLSFEGMARWGRERRELHARNIGSWGMGRFVALGRRKRGSRGCGSTAGKYSDGGRLGTKLCEAGGDINGSVPVRS